MTFTRWFLAAALTAAACGAAAADEPSGCAAFRWPLDRERVELVRPDRPSLANGGALAYNVATTLKLAPFGEAGLPKAPERAPKSQQSYAGHFTLPALAAPGRYKVTITSEGWIDVLDGGDYLHPAAFSGAMNCEGARKSVKFDLPARPLAVQFSGVKDDQISIIVSPGQ
jgi:hypothetical protein